MLISSDLSIWIELKPQRSTCSTHNHIHVCVCLIHSSILTLCVCFLKVTLKHLFTVESSVDLIMHKHTDLPETVTQDFLLKRFNFAEKQLTVVVAPQIYTAALWNIAGGTDCS